MPKVHVEPLVEQEEESQVEAIPKSTPSGFIDARDSANQSGCIDAHAAANANTALDLRSSFAQLKRKSKERRAYVTFKINGLSKIDLTEQIFDVDMVLRVRWNIDPKFETAVRSVCNAVLEKERFWRRILDFKELTAGIEHWTQENGDASVFEVPSLMLRNTVGSPTLDHWGSISYQSVDKDGKPIREEEQMEAIWNLRVTGQFFERLELQQFPFDTQNLKIYCSCDWDNFVLVNDPQHINSALRRARFHLQEYVLHYPVFAAYTEGQMEGGFDDSSGESIPLVTHPDDSSSMCVYSQVCVIMRVERRLNYYVWNHFLILFLLCSISLGSVYVEGLADRCSITLTLILTVVAFKFILVDQLPKTGYLTLLDHYILSCFILVLATTMENVVAAAFEDDLTYDVEQRIFMVLGVIWLFWNVAFGVWVKCGWSKNISHLKQTDQQWESSHRCVN